MGRENSSPLNVNLLLVHILRSVNRQWIIPSNMFSVKEAVKMLKQFFISLTLFFTYLNLAIQVKITIRKCRSDFGIVCCPHRTTTKQDNLDFNTAATVFWLVEFHIFSLPLSRFSLATAVWCIKPHLNNYKMLHCTHNNCTLEDQPKLTRVYDNKGNVKMLSANISNGNRQKYQFHI